MKKYLIKVVPKNPSWNDVNGYVHEVNAKTLTEAYSIARKETHRHCIYDRHDGPLIYSRVKEED